jgi:hypothetical protein
MAAYPVPEVRGRETRRWDPLVRRETEPMERLEVDWTGAVEPRKREVRELSVAEALDWRLWRVMWVWAGMWAETKARRGRRKTKKANMTN